MKYTLILFIQAVLLGCSESTTVVPNENDTLNELVGTWVSNCYADNLSFGFLYIIKEIEFTADGFFISNATYYSDFNCTIPNNTVGTAIPTSTTYVVGNTVISSDGNPAKLITLTSDITGSLETSYRVTGDELNLGDTPLGSLTELNYTVTYVKQ